MLASARVPAWKRLGLQLKRQAPDTSNGTIQTVHSEPAPKKRRTAPDASYAKVEPDGQGHFAELDVSVKSKRDRKSAEKPSSKAQFKPSRSAQPVRSKEAAKDSTPAQLFSPSVALVGEVNEKKTVKFAEDAKTEDAETDGPANAEVDAVEEEVALAKRRALKRQKKEVKQIQKAEQRQLQGPTLPRLNYLTYLEQFHHHKESWKFNKTYQTQILKDLFNLYRIPATHHIELLSYISGLQGEAARSRVRASAEKILEETQDVDLPTAWQRTRDTTPENATSMENEEVEQTFYLAALRRDMKIAKKVHDEMLKAEDQQTVEGKLKLLKRKRATEVLEALQQRHGQAAERGQPVAPQTDAHYEASNGNSKAKRRRGARGKKRRTGVPDDDSPSSDDEDLLKILTSNRVESPQQSNTQTVKEDRSALGEDEASSESDTTANISVLSSDSADDAGTSEDSESEPGRHN